MDWMAEQIAEMRKDRPTYVEFAQGYSVFLPYHTVFTETFQILEGTADGRGGIRDVSLKPGDEASASPPTVHGWHFSEEGQTRLIMELRPVYEGFEQWVRMLSKMGQWADHTGSAAEGSGTRGTARCGV
ncbi:MAG TPA: hypothetical protein VIG82_03225 [Enteractinococcus sp.]